MQREGLARMRAALAIEPQPYRRPALLLAVLPLPAVLFVASMPLAWHHRDIPGAGFTIVHGIQGANWLLVVAALLAGLEIRLILRTASYLVLFFLALSVFVTAMGMFADYVDNLDRAAQLYVSAYVGPGFYAALAGTFVLVAVTVLAWRERP